MVGRSWLRPREDRHDWRFGGAVGCERNVKASCAGPADFDSQTKRRDARWVLRKELLALISVRGKLLGDAQLAASLGRDCELASRSVVGMPENSESKGPGCVAKISK